MCCSVLECRSVLQCVAARCSVCTHALYAQSSKPCTVLQYPSRQTNHNQVCPNQLSACVHEHTCIHTRHNLKSRIFHQKSPIFHLNSPTFYQKSPIFHHKIPVYSTKITSNSTDQAFNSIRRAQFSHKSKQPYIASARVLELFIHTSHN